MEIKAKNKKIYRVYVSEKNYDSDPFFKEVLLKWLDNNRIKYKGATEKRYLYLINSHIIPALGNERISQLTSTKINYCLLGKLENGRLDGTGSLSPSYVRSIMLIINAAHRFAVNEGLCHPLKTPIYKPPISNKGISILSCEEQKTIEVYSLNNINKTTIGIMLSLYTGIRIGEVCALSWSDIDLNNNIIHINHTIARVKDEENQYKLVLDSPKTPSSKRDIPISSQLQPLLLKYKNNSTSKFVVSDTSNFVNPRTFDNRFHKVIKAAGISQINFHVLRHTFATRCVQANIDVKTLSEILGHSNMNITLNTYVHSSMEIKKQQIEKLTTVYA